MEILLKYKKIIFIIIFLAFSFLMAMVLYTLFFKSAPTEPGIVDDDGQSIGFPDTDDGRGQVVDPQDPSNLPYGGPDSLPATIAGEVASGGLTKTTTLSDVPVSSFTRSGNGRDIQFYNQSDGKFYKLDKDGNMIAMSDRVFHQVESVAWSNAKDKAVIEYPDGANIVYDFEKEKQITLPKHWEEFEFSPNDKQIVSKSIGLDPANRWLVVANADGSNTQSLEPLGNNADSVTSSWSPNNQSVAMFTEGIDFNRQRLFFVGKNQENFKSTIIEGRGFQPLWSPDGTRLLYSVYSNDNDMKPKLWVVNAQGENIGTARKSLGVETWAKKCSFSGTSNIYCAVPINLQEGAGLFPELANETTDVIFKIDITTGTKKLVSIPDREFTIADIVVSDDEKTLFFVDKKEEKVHKIDM